VLPQTAADSHTIEHRIEPWPAHVGAATVTLTLLDDIIQSPARTLCWKPDMTHPGMRPEFGATKEIGLRAVSRRINSHGGDW